MTAIFPSLAKHSNNKAEFKSIQYLATYYLGGIGIALSTFLFFSADYIFPFFFDHKYDLSILIGFTVQTFKYSDQVLGHELLCNRIAQKMRDDGEPEERITDLIGNYRQAGNYWKEMKMLGAPEWLSGPNPNK